MLLSLPQIKAPLGVILYRGVSQLDGKTPIVAVATLHSDNIKTGDMIQTWIIRDRIDPMNAVYSGRDGGICGDCKHRGDNGRGRTCYVNIATAPNAVYNALKAGRYLKPASLTDALPFFKNRATRIGSYGDPAAVPFAVWEQIAKASAAVTSYSHQWRQPKFDKFKAICMASCDSQKDFFDARRAGWRTFRVRAAGKPLYAGEFECPASPEGGLKRTCNSCRACGGTRFGTLSPKAGNVSIVVHGRNKARFGQKD